MKKTIIVLIAVLGLAVAASAQPRAIGVRMGVFEGGLCQVSYEHSTRVDDFVQLDLGGYTKSGSTCFDLTGTYNWMVAKPEWTARGEWGFYLGAGASIGTYMDKDQSDMRLGILGQAGLEYTFPFPLQLSADIRPYINFGNAGFIVSPCLSARYRF